MPRLIAELARRVIGHSRTSRLEAALFAHQCRGILDTPPLQPRPAPLRVVSMVSSRDVTMYLLAIKSFYRWLDGGDVIVIDDGTLTEADRALIARHVGGVSIVPMDSISTGPCPRGGTWERLLHILDLSADGYVVQIDSDVLTLGPMTEIAAAMAANTAFTLTSSERFGIVDVEAASDHADGADARHMQVLAEQRLRDLPAGLGRRYVRGSSGFAGFAKGGASRADAEAFSTAMEGMLGKRWHEWGSEQVTSNYIVANSPGGEILPWSRYRCHYGRGLPPETCSAHFIGSWRYDDGLFVSLARRVIAELAGEARR